MTEREESALLLDLLSLSKRYGAENIRDLGDRIRSEKIDDNVFRLLDVLENRALVLRAISRYSDKLTEESRIEAKLKALKEEDRDLLSRFIGDLCAEKVFPSREDVFGFAGDEGIPLLDEAPRRVYVSLLLDHVIDMPNDSMRSLINGAYRRAGRKNSLANWASIIIRK